MTLNFIDLDYWFYKIGVNVIAADTVNKKPIEGWLESQNKPISPDLFEINKKNGLYNKGIAVIPGKVWRGPHKDKYLVFIDLDNQKAIDEICICFGAKDLEELSRYIIVEQHKDNLSKAHLYFYSDILFKKKSSDVFRYKDKIKNNEIPAIEVKGLGEHGIAYCSPSLHEKGQRYEIIGTKEPKMFGKEIEDLLFEIYKIYGLNIDDNNQKIPIEKLFEKDFVILEGHNRHEGLLRATESLILRNKNILSAKKIKELAFDWNQEHCDPPLDNNEFEKQWNCAIDFAEKNEIAKEENIDKFLKGQSDSISKILKAIKQRYIEIFLDQFNEFYVTLKISNHIECVPFESNRFKNIIRKEYFDEERQILSEDKLNGILKLIESQLMYNNEDIRKIELNLRVAKLADDSFYYDLTNSKWAIIKITSEGWNIIKDNEIPIFKRYVNNSNAQVYPAKEYDENIFSRFLKLFNLESKNDILLLSVYIISLFVPDIPKCILVISGAGGGAKTTTFEIIKNIVDPGSVDTFSFPKQINDLIQTLAHHYVNFFDNVSEIPDNISDLLCRSVSGAGFNKRALYSNDEDFIYKFKRGIGVNGINLATTRADFLDRSLVIKLKRIDAKARKKKEDIDKEFENLRSFVLGYILDVLVEVLKYKKDHKDEKILNGYPRMADFAEWGEVIAQCIGYNNGEFIKSYQENIDAQNDEVIESSPVAEVLILFVREIYKDHWEGTPTSLYKELTDIADQIKPELKKSNLWPKASNKLTSKINEVEPNLKEKGIEIITGEKDSEGNRVIKIRKLQKSKVNENDEEGEQLFNPFIHRMGYSDIWECDKCILKGDKHFMKQHICTKN